MELEVDDLIHIIFLFFLFFLFLQNLCYIIHILQTDKDCYYSVHEFFSYNRSFAETMNSLRPEKKSVTKLSSAGLVYLHFGHRVLANILGTKPTDDITNTIYDKVYELFVEEVDAIDNGISTTDEKPR